VLRLPARIPWRKNNHYRFSLPALRGRQETGIYLAKWQGDYWTEKGTLAFALAKAIPAVQL